jgi:AP-1 complex subunit beta-1
MIERVIPRLQHVNPSVVLAAIKVLMVYLQFGYGQDVSAMIQKKLGPPIGIFCVSNTF